MQHVPFANRREREKVYTLLKLHLSYANWKNTYLDESRSCSRNDFTGTVIVVFEAWSSEAKNCLNCSRRC